MKKGERKQQQRYASETAIVEAIDTLVMKAMCECRDAEKLDKEADWLFEQINKVTHPDKLKGHELAAYHSASSEAKLKRSTAFILRRVQGRRQKQIERLGKALAEFRTAPMAFLGENNSVAVERA